MYWKFVNRWWLQKSSITSRLSAWFALAMLLILLLISSLTYYSLVNILDKAGHEFLVDEVAILTTILRDEPKDAGALQQEVIWNPTPNKVRKDRAFFYYIRISDEHGRVVMVTPEMDRHVSGAIYPPMVSVANIPLTLKKWRSEAGATYLLLTIKSPLGHSKESRIMHIALDISYQQAILTEFLYQLFNISLCGVLLAALIGSWITRKNMQQLQDITKTAQLITANDLGQRFNPEALPRELSNLASAFNAMLIRIENAFLRLSQFSADLAHELRTPFNNLMGEAEIALSRQRSATEYKHVIESSLEEYHRLVQMMESMLFLARANDPQLKLQTQPIACQAAVQSVIEYHEPIAAEKNIQILITGDGAIHADPSLFRRAVTNLVSNALQYTPVGGRIDVTIDAAPQQVVIVVKDNGIGIPKEHLLRIFDRFYRVDAARSQHSGGTGLGLAIVASIMALHNGEVAISSEPGQFTLARLVFPAI